MCYTYLSEFGTNTNGTCTVLATAILLGFYDYFYSDEYVDELYEDGAGTNQAFHHLLNVYVYGNATPSNGGIYIRNAASKINTYLDNRSVEANFEYAYHLLVTANLTNSIINKIRAGKPVVASMETIRGAEWNHTVVVYGVTYDTSNPTGTAVYTAHMGGHGDGNSEVLLNCSWFYEYGYIVCGHETHIACRPWSFFTSTQCRSNCECGQTMYRSHEMDDNGYCVYCGEYVEE